MCPYIIFQSFQFHSGSSRCAPDQKHDPPPYTSRGPLTLYMLNLIPTQVFGIEPVNYRVPKTVRHGTSLHRICPKLSIDSSPSQLESQTSVRRPTEKLFGSSPIRLESQASVCWPTLKLFSSSPSRLDSPASVHLPSLKLFGSSPSRLSFDQHRNFWIAYHPYVILLSQPLTTHVLDVCRPPVTETKMPPIVSTAQN